MHARQLGPMVADEIAGLPRFARTVTRDPQQSEDLVQEAVVRALERDDAYAVDASAVVLRAEARDELEDALLRLPVIYRTAAVLHDAEGRPAVASAARCPW